MLKLEVRLPLICTSEVKRVDLCAEIPDQLVIAEIRQCRLEHCHRLFIPAKPQHEFCCAEHRVEFHNKKRE